MRKVHFTVVNGARYCKGRYKPTAKLRAIPADSDCLNCLSKFIRSYGLKRRVAAPVSIVVHPTTPEDRAIRRAPTVDVSFISDTSAVVRKPKVYKSKAAIDRDFGPRKPPKRAPLRYRTRSG